MSWSSQKKKEYIFCNVCFVRRFFNIWVLSQYIVYWINFQNIYTFTYILLHTLLLHVFKIVESLQRNLNRNIFCVAVGKKTESKSSFLQRVLKMMLVLLKYHCVNYRNYTWFPSVEILWKCTVFAEFRATCPKICGDCAFPQNFHTRKFGKITVIYAMYWPK